jgi:hypothetical protein
MHLFAAPQKGRPCGELTPELVPSASQSSTQTGWLKWYRLRRCSCYAHIRRNKGWREVESVFNLTAYFCKKTGKTDFFSEIFLKWGIW